MLQHVVIATEHIHYVHTYVPTYTIHTCSLVIAVVWTPWSDVYCYKIVFKVMQCTVGVIPKSIAYSQF